MRVSRDSEGRDFATLNREGAGKLDHAIWRQLCIIRHTGF